MRNNPIFLGDKPTKTTAVVNADEIPLLDSQDLSGGRKKVKKVTAANLKSSIGGVQSVVAGSGVSVDNTDPANPIISLSGQTGTNIWDKSNLVQGFRIQVTSPIGVIADANASWTGYVAVTAGKKLTWEKWEGAPMAWAFFDSSQVILSAGQGGNEAIVPSNAAFFGHNISANSSELPANADTFKLYQSDVVLVDRPESYQPNYLPRYKYKKSLLLNSQSAQLRVAIFGDSLTQVVTDFSKYAFWLADLMFDKYGKAGTGYIGFGISNTTRQLNVDPDGATVVVTGSPIYNTRVSNSRGVDIMSVTFTAAGSITTTISGANNKGQIHYRKTPAAGTFRYRINGGSWTTVNAAQADAYGVEAFDLSGNPGDVVTIEWVSGVVAFVGIYAFNENANGVIVNKFGCRSLTAAEAVAVDEANWVQGLQAFSPDVFTIMLGTNDANVPTSPDIYKDNIKEIVRRARLANATCDILLIAPPADLRVGTNIYAFTEKLVELAKELNAAFIDLAPIIGTPDQINAVGSYVDQVHFNVNAGKAIADYLFKKID